MTHRVRDEVCIALLTPNNAGLLPRFEVQNSSNMDLRELSWAAFQTQFPEFVNQREIFIEHCCKGIFDSQPIL